MSKFILKNGSGSLCCRGCGRQDNKLNTYDWLADIPGNTEEQDMVEVQFKNTRKGYYKNSNKLKLEKGDIVAVEASPGHDIGTVTLTGRLVPLQMAKANLKPDVEIKRVYRKAKPVDMEKYAEAKKREHDTMIRSRQIAADLGLQMKIGDVEYQGDGNKAIFYYIADERVDFRQLIKVLAEVFRVRIEMKQIGARQEAGRIGGIGPCGRELCCATWMTNFISVSTSAARYQDISLNPQKLAGQCAKLKCCLNYEVDAYVECQKRLPSKEIELQTLDATYYYFKADILKGTITYSTDKSFLANEATITARRAFEIINMNRNGEKPEKLQDDGHEEEGRSKDLLEQESLTRFDKSRNARNKKKRKLTDRQTSENKQENTGDDQRQEARPNEKRKDRNGRNGNQENNQQQKRQGTEERQEKQLPAVQQPKQRQVAVQQKPQRQLPVQVPNNKPKQQSRQQTDSTENAGNQRQGERRESRNNNRNKNNRNRNRQSRKNNGDEGNRNDVNNSPAE
ncbi:regulatory iron-sulfur-containing complex subunit RicT [uncultured Bacteroides sp.]|uniref:PSP1 domain-containing protein n=1 Tax=uncultured Bacteroides sp. TaxID=162156 RepID=UPI002606495B|nr:regulatory iron-sulfur-containing complex subunit RicT [uncultured Bacteroides sp.]